MKDKTFKELFKSAGTTKTYWQKGVIIEFTQAVCKRLEELKMSRADFARQLNVSPAYITRMLKGGENYTLHSMFKICEALNLKIKLKVSTKFL